MCVARVHCTTSVHCIEPSCASWLHCYARTTRVVTRTPCIVMHISYALSLHFYYKHCHVFQYIRRLAHRSRCRAFPYHALSCIPKHVRCYAFKSVCIILHSVWHVCHTYFILHPLRHAYLIGFILHPLRHAYLIGIILHLREACVPHLHHFASFEARVPHWHHFTSP